MFTDDLLLNQNPDNGPVLNINTVIYNCDIYLIRRQSTL